MTSNKGPFEFRRGSFFGVWGLGFLSYDLWHPNLLHTHTETHTWGGVTRDFHRATSRLCVIAVKQNKYT